MVVGYRFENGEITNWNTGDKISEIKWCRGQPRKLDRIYLASNVGAIGKSAWMVGDRSIGMPTVVCLRKIKEEAFLSETEPNEGVLQNWNITSDCDQKNGSRVCLETLEETNVPTFMIDGL